MSETLGEAMDRLQHDIDNLSFPLARWAMRRRMRLLRAKLARERDRALRRFWTS